MYIELKREILRNSLSPAAAIRCSTPRVGQVSQGSFEMDKFNPSISRRSSSDQPYDSHLATSYLPLVLLAVKKYHPHTKKGGCTQVVHPPSLDSYLPQATQPSRPRLRYRS